VARDNRFEALAAGSPDLIVILDENRSQAAGHIQYRADPVRPIWMWQITVDDAVIANGAASSPAKAKAAIRLAWKGHRAAVRVPRPARPARITSHRSSCDQAGE
jgi:hypothetical protein